MQTLFIVNPRSGRALRVLPAVRAYAATIAAEVQLTEAPQHAAELAEQALARGVERIVAVGGDGTLNEVARPLVGTDSILGLVPCGSGNGLGRHLGIHGPLTHVLGVLQAGNVRTIDTGLAAGHPFFTVAGLGFEADVAARFNQLRHRGFLRYLHTSATALRDASTETCWIEYAGQRVSAPVFTLAVANSDQYGNSARIAPGARVDDGLLDLAVVPKITAFNAVSLVTRLFTGSLVGAPGTLHLRNSQFIVERAAPGPLHTDGEIHSVGRRILFTVRPASLHILAPAPAAAPLPPLNRSA